MAGVSFLDYSLGQIETLSALQACFKPNIAICHIIQTRGTFSS
jgi:hypothetical protein